MLPVAMEGLEASEFRRSVLKAKVQVESWIEPLPVVRIGLNGSSADLVPNTDRWGELCQEEGLYWADSLWKEVEVCHCCDRLSNSRYMGLTVH